MADSDVSALRSWDALAKAVMRAGEADCLRLLEAEKAMPRPRGMYLLRIHSRMNRLRARREREELMALVEEPPASKGF